MKLRNLPLTLPREAGSAAELSEEAAERTLDSARTVYEARPQAKATARKTAAAAPLPPWLQPKRRH